MSTGKNGFRKRRNVEGGYGILEMKNREILYF
jgi:hypothetical protein